jgi:tetratricopeptide (TPR) repeat protein
MRSLAQIGNFSETLRYGEEAIQTATERDYPLSIVFAYFAVGAVALIQGKFDQALAALEHSLKVCEASEIPVQRPLVVSGLAAAYAFVGRFDEALRLLENTANRSVWMPGVGSRQVPLGKAMGMVWEVETYTLAGAHTEAEALARRALAVFAESKHRGSEAWLHCLMGDLLTRRQPADLIHAEASYKEALSLAQDLGMRPLQARCYLGLGQIHAQSKNASVARSELHAAAELYRAMGMPFWLARADLVLAAIS